MSALRDRIEKAIEDSGFAQTIEERHGIGEEVEDAVLAWIERRFEAVGGRSADADDLLDELLADIMRDEP